MIPNDCKITIILYTCRYWRKYRRSLWKMPLFTQRVTFTFEHCITLLQVRNHKVDFICNLGSHILWVIPCQINKEFWVTSRILTKLGVFVVPMVLTTHSNFWPHTLHSFWFMTTSILNILWKIGPFWVIKSTIAHHCVIIVKRKF